MAKQPSREEPVSASEILLQSTCGETECCEATFCKEHVWIESTEYDSHYENPRFGAIIQQRVKDPVTLLN